MPFMASRSDTQYCTPICKAAASARRRRDRGYKYEPTTRQNQQYRAAAKGKESYKAKVSAERARVYSFVAEYKLERGCVDCGYNKHHAALEFDHVRGEKRFSIANIRTIPAFYQEVEKCEVVCSNCHAIRTYARLHLAKERRWIDRKQDEAANGAFA